MKSPDRYLIGPGLRTKLREVITRVDGMPDGGGADTIPVRLQDMPRGGQPLRIGKTTATWTKNTLATITLYESGTPPNETASTPPKTLEGCVNKWGDVQANKWVGLQRGATGPYYLVVAEC
jgi:hypothetical protein